MKDIQDVLTTFGVGVIVTVLIGGAAITLFLVAAALVVLCLKI
jgi:hypothetical protein